MKRKTMKAHLDPWGDFLTCDIHGRPFQRAVGDEDLGRQDPPRTKSSHPYAYDPFTIWGAHSPNPKCNGSVYVDRLEQWDRAKYKQLAEEVYEGCRPFDSYNCKGDRIQEFLRRWNDDPALKLLRVIEYCNWSSGYPTWRLDYITKKKH
jgi:hypothetical protein